MVELVPHPFGRLAARMFREFDRHQAIFDLPRTKFFTGSPRHDLGVTFHGQRASSALGPAAGPQSQLAQNLVLAWLGGSRILELKTVQVNDRLTLPRPCIDMRTVGFNVEWSQELRLEQSAEEYVKGMMLIELLRHSGRLPLAAGFADTLFDLSVGYDLAGIRSDGVRRFLDTMRDAGALIERLRAELPAECGELRDLAFPSRIASTLTLSTFHGCPPDEIEAIIDHLLREHGLHCVVKLNPTLLGAEETRHLLHDVLGYRDLHVPDTAFERDTTWPQATGFIERLAATAHARGLGFGVKFSNTLIVTHDGDFLPGSEREKYLSGAPLHVLAMHLVARLRERFGAAVPISFSAGIDRANFADALALGLVPVTVCSDLLKPGGYGRQRTYFEALLARMDAVGATDVGGFVLRAAGQAEAAFANCGGDAEAARAALAGTDPCAAVGAELFARWVAEAAVLNTAPYVAAATADVRYRLAANHKSPKKIGSTLVLFDCVTCDKCIPVCPNDANFVLALAAREIPIQHVRSAGAGFAVREAGSLVLKQRHQIANFADFCNECGNCDVFCPEDGGPYHIKPRFFGSEAEWRTHHTLDGFHVSRMAGQQRVLARIAGREFELRTDGIEAWFCGERFALRLRRDDPIGSLTGSAEVEVDLTWYHIVELVREAIIEGGAVTWAAP